MIREIEGMKIIIFFEEYFLVDRASVWKIELDAFSLC